MDIFNDKCPFLKDVLYLRGKSRTQQSTKRFAERLDHAAANKMGHIFDSMHFCTWPFAKNAQGFNFTICIRDCLLIRGKPKLIGPKETNKFRSFPLFTIHPPPSSQCCKKNALNATMGGAA